MPWSPRYWLPLFFFALAAPAFAAPICGWDGDHLDYNCEGENNGASAGASAPLLGDSLESNPAALPTSPTPFGLEGIWSNRSWPKGKSKFGVSTIEGFDGIGFGLGSWSDGTFSAPDFDNHFLGTADAATYQSYVANPPNTFPLRLGLAIVLPKGPFPKWMRFSVGGSLGLGRVPNSLSPEGGVLLRILNFGFGVSNSYEKISMALPQVVVTTYSLGIWLWRFFIGYSHIVLKSSINDTWANTFGIRFTTSTWTLYGNIKTQIDYHGIPDEWDRAGIQHRLGKLIGIGYEYGLYRYSHSAILQVYL